MLPPYYHDLKTNQKNHQLKKHVATNQGREGIFYSKQEMTIENTSRIISMLKQYGKEDMERATMFQRSLVCIPGSSRATMERYKPYWSNKIGYSLDRSDLSGSNWAKNRLCVIARSLVLPCIITLKGDDNAKVSSMKTTLLQIP